MPQKSLAKWVMPKWVIRSCAIGILASVSLAIFAESPTAPVVASTIAPKPQVYFIAPLDGQQLGQTVLVKFGLSGMGVAPAGIAKDNTGHHHLLIDVDTLPALDQPLPANEHIRHFGGGQTEASITLSPGKHTLQLVLANHLHVPLGADLVSEKITVEVK